MDIDTIYIKTGEFGLYQKKAFAAYFMASVFLGCQMVQNIFAGMLPGSERITCDSNQSISGCDHACPLNDRNYNQTFTSIATEWHMSCEDDLRVDVDNTQSVYMFGVMTGSFFMGGLGDRFGRFPIFFGSHILTSLFALASSFAMTWLQYAAVRFCTGFFLSGIIIVGFVLTSESVGPSKRAIVSTMGGMAFAFGICLLSLLAYALKDWRNLSITTAGFGVILIPMLYCWVEESPRWHMGKGDMQKCKNVLTKITRVNGFDLGDIDVKVPTDNKEKDSNGMSASTLMTNRLLLKLLVIQIISWFSISAMYYGLTLAAGKLKGLIYVTVAMNALVEIPANILITFVMNIQKLGRVRSCVISMLISSVCCASIMFIDDSYSTTVVVMACSGKFFICGAFAIIYVQAAEIFPTPVRNVGIGLVSVANRIGGVLAPQFVGLDNVYHNSHFIVFGTMGCVSGLLCWLLPETVGKPLPQTIEDIGKANSKKNVRSDRQKLLENDDDDVTQF